jgi:hypothetical protein
MSEKLQNLDQRIERTERALILLAYFIDCDGGVVPSPLREI